MKTIIMYIIVYVTVIKGVFAEVSIKQYCVDTLSDYNWVLHFTDKNFTGYGLAVVTTNGTINVPFVV